MYENRCGGPENITFTTWLNHETPFICENWLPKCQWVEDECFPEYLPKNKLSGWF